MIRKILSSVRQLFTKDDDVEQDISEMVKGMDRAQTLLWAKQRSGKLQRRVEVNFGPEVFHYQDGELKLYADTSRIDL